MYFFLILFFGSLLGIIFMLARKLRVLGNGQVVPAENMLFEAPHLEEINAISVKIIKKLGYFLLVETIRLYVRFAEFLRNKYRLLKIKIKNKLKKTETEGPGKIRIIIKEPNKFLRVIAEYKGKLRKIKANLKI